MDLILWRHADAQEGHDPASPSADAQTAQAQSWSENTDLARCLSSRGIKQASRVASWLDRQLTDRARIMVSPAIRCEQTALALGRKYKICPELAPWASVDDLLALVQWPVNKLPVLVVGHQPTLGQTVSRLLGSSQPDMAFRKGTLWWLRSRERDGLTETVVVTVQSPEFL